MGGELPAATFLDDEAAGGVFLLFGFVDGEEDETAFAFDFGGGAGDEVEGNAVEVEGDFVTGILCFG